MCQGYRARDPGTHELLVLSSGLHVPPWPLMDSGPGGIGSALCAGLCPRLSPCLTPAVTFMALMTIASLHSKPEQHSRV